MYMFIFYTVDEEKRRNVHAYSMGILNVHGIPEESTLLQQVGFLQEEIETKVRIDLWFIFGNVSV